VWAHAVQVGYVVLPNGFIRVYIEHWHGDQTTGSLAGNGMSITTTYGTTTVTQNVNPTGAVNNTAWNQLPGAGSNIIILHKTSSANYYNDWAYYDFAPAACNVPVNITLNGGLTVVLTGADGSIWPQTISGTFNDTSAPTITVANNTASVSCGVTGANVNFTATAIDNCTHNPAVTFSTPSGSFFPVGTTYVTAYSSDDNGNSGQITFPVTVNVIDNVPPTLTVPGSISVGNSPGICGATVTYAAPIAADDCSSATLTQIAGLPSGSVFPTGTTTNTFKATDAAGNTVTASFNVTVADTEAPIPAISSTGSSSVNIPDGNSTQWVPYTYSFSDPLPAGSTIIGVDIQYTGVDQGWGGTGDYNNLQLAGTYLGGNQYFHYSQNFNISFNGAVPNYQYGGVNSFQMFFTGYPGWVGYFRSGKMTIRYKNDKLPDVIGECSVTINAAPTANDNCSGLISATTPDPLSYNQQGTYLVHWTYKDAAGNTSSQTQNVIVKDVTAPVAPVLADVTGECSASISAAPVAVDNCAGNVTGTTTDALSYATQGTHVVTWKFDDGHGNVSTTTQNVIVKDLTAPVAPVLADVIGQCDATVTAPTAQDNCTGTIVGTTSSPLTYTAQGTYVITWSFNDGHGNISTATQKVIVEDKVAPIITVPISQEICFVAAGTYSLPVLAATDNCAVASTSYVMTGATTRSGNSNDASGTLNTGLTTITWTVTDVHGNASTASNTIRIWPLPVVTLASSSADEFCNKVTLVPTSTIPAVSYNWVYNNSTFSASATLALGIADQDGEYKLYVTDIHGCVNTQLASYTFSKQDVVSSYTILGLRSVKLGENNNVLSGSVGAMGNKGKVEVKKYSSINSPGAFVKAKSIKVDKNATVPTKIYAPVVTTLPTMQYFSGSTKNLPKYEAKINGILTGNYSELKIKKGITVTLTGNLFGKIEIEDGANVTFTSSVINIMDMDVDGSSNGNNDDKKKNSQPVAYTLIKFATDAVVKVSDKVDIEDHVKVNPDGKKVIFYVGSIKDHKGKGNHDEDDKCPNFKKDDDHRDRENDRDDEGDDYYGKGEFKINGGDAYVTASVYVPEGKIKVNGGEKATSYLTGTFIAEYVQSDVKNVIWNSFSCDASNTSGNNLLTTNGTPSVLDKSGLGINLTVIEEPSKLLAYPNPFKMNTTVSFKLPYAEENTTLDIFDLRGVRIQTLYKGTANANQNYEVKFDGSNIAAGTYFFRLTTSQEAKNFKVIMTN
ncbi:MAG: HYR domain-containing protein, partial [Bacteroidetes bacterium]|nr:HYR domain-containing protein [Bacteroidota bacterium]